MRICNICGKKVDYEVEDIEAEIFNPYVQAFLQLLNSVTDCDFDLCKECRKEMLDTFIPKLKAITEEISEWIKVKMNERQKG